MFWQVKARGCDDMPFEIWLLLVNLSKFSEGPPVGAVTRSYTGICGMAYRQHWKCEKVWKNFGYLRCNENPWLKLTYIWASKQVNYLYIK